MVQIRDLVHRLGDRHPIQAVNLFELVAGDGDGLVAIGLADDAGGDEIAQAAAAEEVAQAGEPLAVPGEEDGARAGLAVVLGDVEGLVGGEVHLALHDAVGPGQMQ